MKVDVISGVAPHQAGRIRLTGWVCGVMACEIIADSDDLVVGSAIQCDFVVPDPLIPPRAFRLRRVKCHAGTEQDCRCHWVLDVFRDARVYVNRQLTSREQLTYGDVISIGCHDLAFQKEADTPRNVRANRNVSDICRRLMKDYPLPPGFLRNTAAFQYAARRRVAASAVGLAAAVLLLLVWQAPQVDVFEPVQPPIEIDLTEVLSPDAVRSLDDVARQTFDTQDPAMDKADLVEAKPTIDAIAPAPMIRDMAVTPTAPPTLSGPVIDSGALSPMTLVADAEAPADVQRDTVKLAATALAARQTRPEEDAAGKADLMKSSLQTAEVKTAFLASSKSDPQAPAQDPQWAASSANWKLPPLSPSKAEVKGPIVSRDVAKLAAAAPARRLSVTEAAQRDTEKSDLGGYRVKMDQGLARPVSAKTVDQNLAASLGKPSAETLEVDRAAYMEQLARYKASPVQTESFMGMQVPVARIAEQLAQLEVKEPEKGKALSVDGKVSPEEMDICWKSGRFKTHAPGVPPPDADPATYCYVGKSDTDGKPCLYISFVCVDPDISKILAGSGADGNSGSLLEDDSVEIFLDTNNDRNDYYQMIVNAKGRFWTAYHPRPLFDNGNNTGQPKAWACAPVIKSTINSSAGQWTCEIMIPFDKLGGVPADGSRWAVNFCRNFRGQKADWQLQSWFAVYDKARNFHHPNKFGVFQW